jgi:phosphoserine phosphatase RsbU/P
MTQTFPLDLEALLLVLNYLNLGVYLTDRDRRILLWNRKAEEITGYPAKDVVGKACHQNVLCHADKDGHPLCSSGFCPLYRSILTGQESKEPVLVFAQSARGKRVPMSVSVAPLHDQNGNIIGGIETFRDETQNIQDLEFSRRIQRNLLPKSLPDSDRFHFDVIYYPHDLVGGDFYDILPVGNNRYGLLVADVRGHGVSGALYTMWLKSLEESLHPRAADPANFLTSLNRELVRFVVDESFATAFYGVVDTQNSTLTYCTGGHPSPLHFHAKTAEVTPLEPGGLTLGIMDDEQYTPATRALAPHDVLLCYTDGITEVFDKDNQMLGEKGLIKLFKDLISSSNHPSLDRLYEQVLEFCGSVSLADDVLLLTVTRTE